MHIMRDIDNLLVHNCALTDEFEDNFTTVSRLNIRSCKGATRLFSHLLHPGSALLTTLVLNDCELTSQDLSNLTQAAEEGRLPELKHLDLSNNRMAGEGLMSLFDTSCRWNQLLGLDIGNNLLGRSDITYALMKKVETNGLLGSLQELGIDDYPSVEIIWPEMIFLYLPHCSVNSFRNISEAVHRDCFPALRTICVEKFESYDASLVGTLQKRNIYCHEAITPFYDPLTRVRCYCQITQTEEC